jgi:hypothetical protein
VSDIFEVFTGLEFRNQPFAIDHGFVLVVGPSEGFR